MHILNQRAFLSSGMFRESLGRDASASSNPEPIQEVTLYEIKKKDAYIATNDLVGPGQQN